jgi:hypothetical protein
MYLTSSIIYVRLEEPNQLQVLRSKKGGRADRKWEEGVVNDGNGMKLSHHWIDTDK